MRKKMLCGLEAIKIYSAPNRQLKYFLMIQDWSYYDSEVQPLFSSLNMDFTPARRQR